MTSTDILLVEDDPHDLELTLRAVQRHVHRERVVVVRDGAAALTALHGEGASDRVGLVLLDLELPQLSGTDVLVAIRGHARTRSLWVVVLSSNDDRAVVERVQRLGADRFVRKTHDHAGLLEVLANFAAGNRPGRGGV